MVYPDVNTGGCSAEAYNGSVCRHQLEAWQGCVLERADVFLNATFAEQSLQQRERDVAQFLHFLCKHNHYMHAIALHVLLIL